MTSQCLFEMELDDENNNIDTPFLFEKMEEELKDTYLNSKLKETRQTEFLTS